MANGDKIMKAAVQANGPTRLFLEKLAFPLIVAMTLGIAGTLGHTVLTVTELKASRFSKSAGAVLQKEMIAGDREIRESISSLREDLVRLQELKITVGEIKTELKCLNETIIKYFSENKNRDDVLEKLLEKLSG